MTAFHSSGRTLVGYGVSGGRPALRLAGDIRLVGAGWFGLAAVAFAPTGVRRSVSKSLAAALQARAGLPTVSGSSADPARGGLEQNR